MVDNLKVKAQPRANDLPPNVRDKSYNPFPHKGIRFTADKENGYVADKDSVKAIGLGGLHLKYGRGANALFYLSNSLHKLCHDGLNHTDFTNSQLLDTIQHICTTLDIKANDFKLYGRVEFSVNIPVEDANELIEAWQTYKGKKLKDMYHNSNDYGKKAKLTKYEVKAYNPILKLKYENRELYNALLKGGQITDDNKLLRFETSILTSYVQQAWRIPLFTFKDYEKEAILTAIGAQLVKVAKGMRFDCIFPSNMNYKDLSKCLFFQHATKAQIANFKINHFDAYKEHKKEANKLLQQYSKPFSIAPLITKKWHYLQNH